MTPSEWKESGNYFNYQNHKIFTVDHGKGDVILLIHGFPTASWDWHHLFKVFVKDYRVIALDMLGFGFSDKPKKHHYNIREQATIIEELLTSKGIKKIHILSHDYGDTVVQELLARHQESSVRSYKITSVCFLNGGLFPETHQPLPIQKILMSPLGLLVSFFFNKKKLQKNFARIFGPQTQPTAQTITHFWHLITYNGGKKVFHLLIRYMKERKDNRERWVGAIQNAKIPIRLINGVLDPISGQHMVDRYKKIIPNPDVIELSGIGHFPLIEAPDLVVKHYLDFIKNKVR